jgi:hypothetical protein
VNKRKKIAANISLLKNSEMILDFLNKKNDLIAQVVFYLVVL